MPPLNYLLVALVVGGSLLSCTHEFPNVVCIRYSFPPLYHPLVVGSAKEMDDLLERGNSARIFFTPQWEPWELDAYCEDETAVLEVCIACFESLECSLKCCTLSEEPLNQK